MRVITDEDRESKEVSVGEWESSTGKTAKNRP